MNPTDLPEAQPAALSHPSVAEPAGTAVRWPVKKLLLILAAASTVYAGVLLWAGDGTGASLAPLASMAGLGAAALCLLSYLLRGLRWRLWMAQHGRPLGVVQGLRLYLAGYAFTPTPGNLGEAVRGLMLAQRPLSTLQSLAVFGAERMADLLALLLLCLPVAVWGASQGVLSSRVALGVGGAAVAGALGAAALLWAFRRRLEQRFGWLTQALHCLTHRPWLWAGLTLVAWSAQGLAVWLLARELGVQVPTWLAAGFYALAMVAGALSALPAGLGGTEAVLTGLWVAHGLSGPLALTLTVLVRLLTLWLAVALGVVALFYSAAIRKDIRFS